jgi:hypothetical protein
LLDAILAFLNQTELLPGNARIAKVRSDRVLVRDANGVLVATDLLSDGYRSILSMNIELIRQLNVAFETDILINALRNGQGAVSLPGVVAIDEVAGDNSRPGERRLAAVEACAGRNRRASDRFRNPLRRNRSRLGTQSRGNRLRPLSYTADSCPTARRCFSSLASVKPSAVLQGRIVQRAGGRARNAV